MRKGETFELQKASFAGIQEGDSSDVCVQGEFQSHLFSLLSSLFSKRGKPQKGKETENERKRETRKGKKMCESL